MFLKVESAIVYIFLNVNKSNENKTNNFLVHCLIFSHFRSCSVTISFILKKGSIISSNSRELQFLENGTAMLGNYAVVWDYFKQMNTHLVFWWVIMALRLW